MGFDASALDVGRPEKALPVCGAEGARDRYRSVVVLDEMMKPQGMRGVFERMIGEGMALKIVDEPANPRVRLHPAQEFHDSCVVEVMREERRDDDINGRRWLIVEDICRDKAQT